MAFPLSVTSEFDAPAIDDVAATVSRIAADLRPRVAGVQLSGNHLTFERDWQWFVTGWDPLFGISSGRVRISERTSSLVVAYEIRFAHLLVGTSAVATSLMVMGLSTTHDGELLSWLGAGVLAWTWLHGMNVLTTRYRFRRWLQGVVAPEVYLPKWPIELGNAAARAWFRLAHSRRRQRG